MVGRMTLDHEMEVRYLLPQTLNLPVASSNLASPATIQKVRKIKKVKRASL